MPNINAQALFNACVVGDAAAVSRLLPVGGTPRNLSGPRFQCPDDTKSTPLIAAAMGGHTDIVRMILERAPNTPVDDAVATRTTALMGSALYHHADIIRLLAARGANVNAESQGGRTPLRLAVGRINPNASHRDPDPDGAWQIATVRALLRLGAVRDPVDAAGMTPLCDACNLGLAKVAVALLVAGADIDFATPPRHDYPGFTPLMYAVTGGQAAIVKLLHKRGADGTKTTTQSAHDIDAGSTALDIARGLADSYPRYAETFAALRKRCCCACGVTAPGLAGSRTRLKQCSGCPASGPSAHYCSEQCQRADWVPRHREECAEARRAQQAAGTGVC